MFVSPFKRILFDGYRLVTVPDMGSAVTISSDEQ
jgi:hypothetical protein